MFGITIILPSKRPQQSCCTVSQTCISFVSIVVVFLSFEYIVVVTCILIHHRKIRYSADSHSVCFARAHVDSQAIPPKEEKKKTTTEQTKAIEKCLVSWIIYMHLPSQVLLGYASLTESVAKETVINAARICCMQDYDEDDSPFAFNTPTRLVEDGDDTPFPTIHEATTETDFSYSSGKRLIRPVLENP